MQFFGIDAKPNADDVHIGRDKSISVLGMPIGRRDGISISPMTGVSYGNQVMILVYIFLFKYKEFIKTFKYIFN